MKLTEIVKQLESDFETVIDFKETKLPGNPESDPVLSSIETSSNFGRANKLIGMSLLAGSVAYFAVDAVSQIGTEYLTLLMKKFIAAGHSLGHLEQHSIIVMPWMHCALIRIKTKVVCRDMSDL